MYHIGIFYICYIVCIHRWLHIPKHTRSHAHTHTHTKYLLRATVPYVSFHTFRPPYCHITSYFNVMLHHIILSDHRTVTLQNIMLSPLAKHTVT